MPDIPVFGRHVWEWFIELSAGRTSGFVANPIQYSEIKAWSELTKTHPEIWEVRAIRMMDSEFMEKVGSNG